MKNTLRNSAPVTVLLGMALGLAGAVAPSAETSPRSFSAADEAL